MPIRVQRKRIKGWRMPSNTIYVGRPTAFGNLWHAGGLVDAMMAKDWGHDAVSWFGRKSGEPIKDAAEAVEMYEHWLADCEKRGVPVCIPFLRGKNLACWCALDAPCHADVLLDLANR